MYDSIVLVKQVPDTANITGRVMKDDGTVNRAMLPAVFNLEDRVALELALQTKDIHGGRVTAVSMGPPRAAQILRECLFLGADAVYLVSDRRFAGADTLATSYVLSRVITALGKVDIVFAGRQAIDGDTAQVGPQTAEKLGLPQITCAEKILELGNGKITVRRRIDGGYQVLRSPLPVLLTVIKGAAEPRPFNAQRTMTFKKAMTRAELEKLAQAKSSQEPEQLVRDYRARGLLIPTLGAEDLPIEIERCGLIGSPTKVHKIESVVLRGGQHERVEPTNDGLRRLVESLMQDHILG